MHDYILNKRLYTKASQKRTHMSNENEEKLERKEMFQELI